ncbi:hypothetical protein ON010_g13901 [Phytophthora cinnamomi]|nr:hypothetical protein ON010_g13901 [Phytophthora cinnamomi]
MANPEAPLTFNLDLHRQANTGLGPIATLYLTFEQQNLQAFRETTHYLPITGPQLPQDAVIDGYHHDRRQQRINVGERWRRLPADILPMMREQWANIDLLLDPFFLHLPAPHDTVTWFPGVASRAANAGTKASRRT